ncbi:MAG: LytTR family DNA-binding domain-containing protein [Schaedlerella sp.]|nr:LytTR family DNA-binding domain-containing protein [Schaedlerella sp.]
MLEIVVCDDTQEEKELIVQYTTEFFRKKELDFRIETCSSADELLNSGGSYDLYLLDVLMPGMTGIEIAEQLNRSKQHPAIIFITSSLESAVDGYRVNATGFILKPVTSESFNETMERVIKQKLKQEYLSVMHNRIPLRIPLNRIQYFENKLHKVSIIMDDNEVITVNLKLSQIQDMLQTQKKFLRCHQSYIVNLDYVCKMEDVCFYMCDSKIVPISRNYYKETKNKYYHYRLE